ncbi:MAG: hypothetical protein H6625_10455 [Bdellovibrionaceae bacterium]|nr:hypothetical protein [Pseudobdellovibrionaceae bacterium]
MSRIEKIIATISLLIFCASSIVIFSYDKLFKAEPQGQIIARVDSAKEGSLVKSPDSHEYREIKKDDPIINGDNIISGKNSEILVKFINGPKLVIGEESLISLREVEGQPDLMIEKGSFSGTFEQGDVLDVLTNNEIITLNGEKDTQFSVTHTEGGETEIGSFDKELKVEYNGEKFSLTNTQASVSKKKGFVSQDSPTSTNSKNSKSANAEGGLGNDKSISIDPTVNKQGMALAPPYPKEGHIFLHKTGGKIPVFPKTHCKGPCELSISVNGKKSVKNVFARDMIPFVYINIKADTQAKVIWKFSDGGEEIEGTFDVLIHNSDNFQKAFDKKLPVEIIN